MKKPAIFFVFFACFPETVWGWQQTTTCDNGTACEAAVGTRWKKPCVPFHLHEGGTRQMAFSDIEQVTRASLLQWRRPENSSLTPHFSGLTNENRVGFNPYTDENANIIVFRDDAWEESRAIIALTTVTYNIQTGIISDADIELNAKDYVFGVVAKNGPDVVDLQNTLTHELGHAFGLAHSEKIQAAMYPYSGAGETRLSTLYPDDIEGISSIYPLGMETCAFEDFYFEAPPYGMDENPYATSTCGANVLKMPEKPSINLRMCIGGICVFLGGIFYFRRARPVSGMRRRA